MLKVTINKAKKGFIMKIEKIRAYQVNLSFKEGSINFASGRKLSVFDSTVVEIHTDAGITGYGEVCPLGPFYLPAYGTGVRTGLKELGPQILGEDPLQLNKLNYCMDYHLKGHPYVKTAIDMACWDILGKFTKLPVCTLMGGRFGESIQLYRAISQLPPKEMMENTLWYKKEGYTKFNMKLGSKPAEDIERFQLIRAALDPSDVLVGDANTAWLPHEALRIASAVKDLDVYIEQPCATYEECLTVRQHTDRPFILDENVDSLDILMRMHADRAADVVNLKISKLGGLTKTKQARDLCVSLGIAMTLEDTWGADIITSAIAHLAHSTPEKFRFSSTDFNSYGSRQIAKGAPQRVNGTMQASEKPDLGIEPIMKELGDPVIDI